MSLRFLSRRFWGEFSSRPRLLGSKGNRNGKEVELWCNHNETSSEPTENSEAGMVIRVNPPLEKGAFNLHMHTYTHRLGLDVNHLQRGGMTWGKVILFHWGYFPIRDSVESHQSPTLPESGKSVSSLKGELRQCTLHPLQCLKQRRSK